MGELTLNPFAMAGTRVDGDKNFDFSAEAGVAVTQHAASGAFEGYFSIAPSFSLTGGEKRVSASGTLTGMLFFPVLLTAGPRASYNFDEKKFEFGAMACAQTLLPLSSNTGAFGGLCFTANDVAHLKNDGVSGMLTFTGQL